MGVIPGGFFKREGRPSTKEILTCRIIDRSIRPMFPDGFRRDVQVLSQVIASDRENDGDVVAAIASFAALAVSSLPHGRSLGCVRMRAARPRARAFSDAPLLPDGDWIVLAIYDMMGLLL